MCGCAVADHHPTPWLTAADVAARARCGVKLVYSEIKRGQLRAARIGGRRQIVIHVDWADQWLESMAKPVEVTPLRRVG